MSQNLLVFASATYNTVTLQNELTTLNNANPIAIVISGGLNLAEQAASQWAVTNGIPFIASDPYLDGAGCTAQLKPIYTKGLIGNDNVTTNVLLAGSSARVTAASGMANANGFGITAIN